MFGTVANGTLPTANIYICSPTKNQYFGLELKVLWTKTKCATTFFISSVFTLGNECPKIPYFGVLTDINTVKTLT